MALIATILAFIPVPYWWIRAADFARIQMWVALAVCLVIYPFVARMRNGWNILFEVLLIAGLVSQSVRLYPYTSFASVTMNSADEVALPEREVSIVSANVYMHNRKAEKALEVLMAADADIIIAMETDEWWIEHLEPLAEKYPEVYTKPYDNTYGMAVYSRLPLSDAEWRYLVHDSVPSLHAIAELPSGQRFHLHAMHPKPPQPQKKEWKPENAALKIVGEMVVAEDLPAIVAGDFNDVSWGLTNRLFHATTRLQDPRKGRGFYNTYNAKNPFVAWPLDHVYAAPEFGLVSMELLPEINSDHELFMVKLRWEGLPEE